MGIKHEESGLATVEKTKTKPPKMYKVMLLNDDYTPFDFVIIVLMRFFAMAQQQAERVTMQVHTEGRGVCGIYTRDVADAKVRQVADFARQNQHPLACVMEEN